MKSRRWKQKLRSLLFLCFVVASSSLVGQHKLVYWKPASPAADSLVALLDSVASHPGSDSKPTAEWVRQLGEIAQTAGVKPIIKWRHAYWNSYYNGREGLGITPEAVKAVTEAMRSVDTSFYFYDYARTKFMIADPLRNKSNYLQQYRCYLELLHLFREAGDKAYEASVCRYMGILMAELKNFSKAESYLLEANKLYQQIGLNVGWVTNMVNLAAVYGETGKTDLAIAMIEDFLNNHVEAVDTMRRITTFINLDQLMQGKDNYTDKYARQAYELAHKHANAPYQTALSDVILAAHLLQQHKLDSALALYQKAYRYAAESNTVRLLNFSLPGLAQTYEALGKYQQAYDFMRQYVHLKDSIYGTDNVSEITRIEANVQIERMKDQLVITQQRSELRKQGALVVSLVAALITLLAIILLIYYLSKKKLAEKKLLMQDMENRMLSDQVETQNRELSISSLSLYEKNSMLQNILDVVKRAHDENTISKEVESTISRMIKESVNTEQEWETFKSHFVKTHPDFFKKLKAHCGTLTENELRFCVYMRIGLSQKQIASILSIQHASVTTNRYLLKKKLKLGKEISLDDWIREI